MRKMTRRRFIGSGAAASLSCLVPGRARDGIGRGAALLRDRPSTPRPMAPRAQAPSDRLNIAGIGVGGMGAANLRQLESENIVALCDVDLDYAAGTIERYPAAEVFTDYRVMLEKRRDIDAVVIATPDHTHAVITTAAMQAGKHVYTQKPLTHDVWEARRLTEAARASKVTTQMGIQGHSGEGIRLVVEWIRAGLIGEVREVDAWCDLSYYPWGHAYWSSKWGERPPDTPPVPARLDWDPWIGPAPWRPYHPAYHPLVWRCWWDFGVGMMGDRGAHTLDAAVWALGLDAPETVEATSLGLNAETHPLSASVTYRFPARGGRPPVKLTWYEGTRAPRPEALEDGRKMPEEGGLVFKGAKGAIMCGVYADSPRIVPESLMREAARPAETLPRVEGSHEMDWVRACKAGTKAGAAFEYSGPLTEICLLGNVAKRLDARIAWDAANLRVTNNAEAEALVRKPYREGWSLRAA
ncbi:MAG: Gfo/Idh/MocA family oxidoreductase [Candidatus Aminicenantes bacterium]|nr:Gfo/Idh/MocA family oxidoreductase [Candidatus Aminicenantes bacterium]